MKTPYGTDAQVGFLLGQSKQTCSTVRQGEARVEDGCRNVRQSCVEVAR